MMTRILFVFVFLYTIKCTSFYEFGSDVEVLSQRDWKKVGKDDKLWIVEFYRESCGFCQILMKHWEKVATNLKHMVHIAAVDVTKEGRLANKYQISGVPTIKVFKRNPKKKGKIIEMDYQGERKAKPIIDYAVSQMPNFVIKVGRTKYEDIAFPQIVVFSTKKRITATLKALSSKFEKKVNVVLAHSSDKQLVDEFSAKKFPAIFFKYSLEDEAILFTRKINYNTLDMFIGKVLRKGKKASMKGEL